MTKNTQMNPDGLGGLDKMKLKRHWQLDDLGIWVNLEKRACPQANHGINYFSTSHHCSEYNDFFRVKPH